MQINALFSHNNCKFLCGIQRFSDLPTNIKYPEVAFIGRSNVGKSSLINALLNSKKIARTSKNPGCTQQINLFVLHNCITLADLPGYGHAAATSKARIHSWQKLVCKYLVNRAQLRRTFLLIDGRRGIMPDDMWMMELFSESGVAFQIIITKCDYINGRRLEQLKLDIGSLTYTYPSMHHEILMTSIKNKRKVSNRDNGNVKKIYSEYCGNNVKEGEAHKNTENAEYNRHNQEHNQEHHEEYTEEYNDELELEHYNNCRSHKDLRISIDNIRQIIANLLPINKSLVSK